MVLLDVGSTLQTIGVIATILVPILLILLAIAVKKGWISKETADMLRDIAGATTKAIEDQKGKNPVVAKEITTAVVTEVKDKIKLDNFLKELNLNQ